jgi:hypothetical protein
VSDEQPRGRVDEQALVAVRQAMRDGEPWVVLRLTKSGRYQVIRLAPSDHQEGGRLAS